MKKAKKTAIITAVILILLGLVLVIGTSVAIGFGFSSLNTVTYTEKDYLVSGPIQNIRILGDTADIRFVRSSGNLCAVTCTEQEGVTHTVSNDSGTLTIQRKDNRRWYDHIGIYWGQQETGITVFLPQTQLGSLHIETNIGDISIPSDYSFTCAELETSTGDISFAASVAQDLTIHSHTGECHLWGVTARNIHMETSTGDVELQDVLAGDTLTITSKTGELELEHCDANSLILETATGDVDARLLTGKQFQATSSAGEVNVPPSTQGGSCKITTKTGDIEVSTGF